jgi:hypothetical protein
MRRERTALSYWFPKNRGCRHPGAEDYDHSHATAGAGGGGAVIDFDYAAMKNLCLFRYRRPASGRVDAGQSAL